MTTSTTDDGFYADPGDADTEIAAAIAAALPFLLDCNDDDDDEF